MKKTLIRYIDRNWNKDFNQKSNISCIVHWKLISKSSVYRQVKAKITIEEIEESIGDKL